MIRIPHSLGAVVAILVLTVTPRAQSNDAERLYTQYAAGDRTVVARTLRATERYRALEDDLLRLADGWKDGHPAPGESGSHPPWAPARVAFAFEIGLARSYSPNGASDAVRWMTIARELVTQRPLGPRHPAIDSADRFEVAVHRTAIAVIMSTPGFATLYLDSVAARIDALGRLPGGTALVANLVLARGVARETRTRPLATDAHDIVIRTDGRGSEPAMRLASGQRSPNEQDLMAAALTMFTRLADDPDVGAEADVRRGLLWHRMGNQPRALEAVDQGLVLSRDRIVRYWGQLVRGRVLQALNRSDEARAAYQVAAEIVPTAQTPAAAIAAILLVQNDRAGAEQWAARARAPRDGDKRDPWWLYWFGDLRVLDDLVGEIRGALP